MNRGQLLSELESVLVKSLGKAEGDKELSFFLCGVLVKVQREKNLTPDSLTALLLSKRAISALDRVVLSVAATALAVVAGNLVYGVLVASLTSKGQVLLAVVGTLLVLILSHWLFDIRRSRHGKEGRKAAR